MLRKPITRWALLLLLATGAAAATESQHEIDAARAGQAAGEQARNAMRARLPTYTEEGGRHGEGAIVVQGVGAIPLTDVVPGADAAKAQEMANAAADDTTRRQAIEHAQQQTAQDTSLAAQAYRTGRNSNTDRMSELAGDGTLWRQTDQARRDRAAWDQQYANCVTTTTRTNNIQLNSGAIREQATCEELHIPQPAQITRDVSARADTATILQRSVSAANTTPITLVLDAAAGLQSGDVVGAAEVTVTWTGSVASVAIEELPSAFNSWRGRIVVTPHDPLTQSPENAQITVHAQRTILRSTVSAVPDNPLMGSDSFCTARWTCEDSGARTIDGVLIDDAIGMALPPLYPASPNNVPPSSTSPVCWRASSTYDCPFNLGSLGCWTTPSGERKCHTNTPDNTTTDTCQALRDRRACRFERSNCSDNALGFGDFCYVETQVWGCEDRVNVNDVQEWQRTQCSGELACIGDNCNDHYTENMTGLADTNAKLAVIQHMLSDRRLSDGQPTRIHHPDEGSTAKATATGAPAMVASREAEWFPGEARECRKATGSTMDCCTLTEGDADALWQDAYARHTRRANARPVAARLAEAGVPEQGTWHGLSGGQWSLAALDRPLFSMIEEIGAGGPMPDDGEATLWPVLEEYERTRAAETDPTWQCTAAERMLGAMREAGLCEAVGNYCVPGADGQACTETRNVYCCYNSPMSRQLTVAAQGGPSKLGTPTAPQCGGVGQAVVERISLDDVDLREWKGRYQRSGNNVNAAQLDDKYSEANLTGQGSALATPGIPRKTFTERIQARLTTDNMGRARAQIETSARQQALPPQAEPTDAGEVSLAPTFNAVQAGQTAFVVVRRTGGQGAITVAYQTSDATATAPQDYEATSGTLQWAAGETGEKAFAVRTHQRHGTEQHEFHIVLANVTGGARLGEANGEVRIQGTAAGGGTTPQTQPAITARQYITAVVPSLFQVIVMYRVVLTNTGTETVSGPALKLRLARGELMPLRPETAPAPCYPLPIGSPMTCAPPLTIAPGGTLVMEALVSVEPTGPLESWCSASAVGEQSGRRVNVPEDQCHTTTTATNPGVDSALWGSCGNLRDRPTAVHDFTELFPGRHPPNSDGSGNVTIPQGHSAATAFQVPATVQAGQIEVASVQGISPTTAFIAAISPCAGTWALPLPENATLPFQNAACTNLTISGSGVQQRNQIRYTVQETGAGAALDGACVLRAGDTYYLNFVPLDLSDYSGTGSMRESCAQNCTISQTWTGAAPTNAPTQAKQASKLTAIRSPEDCPAPLAGFARADQYASIEALFLDARGKQRPVAPLVEVNRQQYAAIPFIAPSDGGLLHQLDWEQGSGKAALVTISRCPGDTGARAASDTAPALSQACIATPRGEARNKGTLIFQGGGDSPAQKTCRLFPGTQYFINVFRLGVPGTDEATSGCTKRGEMSCGPRLRVR